MASKAETKDDFPNDGPVLLDWTPQKSDRVHKYDDLAERYVVLEAPTALSGIIIYAMYRGEWLANPWSDRPLVRELIMRLASCPSTPKEV